MRALETKSATVTTGTVVTMSDFAFSDGMLDQANGAKISTITNNINYTEGGDDPTSSLGHPVIKTASLVANIPALISGSENTAGLKMIGLGGSAEVTVTIYR